MTTHYIKHETTGAVHSIDEDHLVEALAVPGWAEIDEKAAREASPQAFGAPDPVVEAARDHDGYGRKVTFTDTGRPVPDDDTPPDA